MRKPFTLSLDEGFVRRVDGLRGMVPRSRWIEHNCVGAQERLGVLEAAERIDGIAKGGFSGDPTLKAERSPEPQEDSGVPREPFVGRRHSPTCKCAVCDPVKS